MGIDMFLLRDIALRRFKKPVQTEEDLINFIKLWWTNKYNLPDNHSLFLDRTLEEHVIDYYLDKFSKNPDEAALQTKEELEADEAKLKAEMGEDYKEEYDYFMGPDENEKDGKEVRTNLPEDVEESFESGE